MYPWLAIWENVAALRKAVAGNANEISASNMSSERGVNRISLRPNLSKLCTAEPEVEVQANFLHLAGIGDDIID